MSVTDQQAGALRAYLVGDAAEGERLTRQLIQTEAVDGLGEFVTTAFVTATRRRFSPTWTRGEVIQFIGRVRALLSEKLDLLDPRIAEGQVRRALGDDVLDEADHEVAPGTRIILLAAIIADLDLDEPGLDEFLDEARTQTGQWSAG